MADSGNIVIALVLGAIASFALGLRPLIRRSRRARERGPDNSAAAPPSQSRQDDDGDASLTLEVLDRAFEGVVVLNEAMKPVLVNAAARKMLGLRGPSPPARLPPDDLLALAQRALDRQEEIEDVVTLYFPERTSVRVRVVPLSGRRRVLLALQDVTQELLAQRIRREFVAHASHELKSPVAGLQALAEALHGAAEEDPERAARFSERLVVEAARLSRLINDLLDLSRLEEATKAPDAHVDLVALAHRQVAESAPAARAKRIRLQPPAATDPIWVRGDEQQLALMIRNLLDNAVRYTPEEGTVTVEVAKDGGEALLAVEDDGIGIPREAQSRVFERFYRVDRARSRERGGTGLGLAIVKHVAELHAGRVELESELGQGSTFTVRLPALSADGAAQSMAP